MEIGQFMWSSQTVVLPERDESLEGIYVITLGRTRKVTPRHRGTRVAGAGGGGWWMEALPWVFDMLQYL